MQLQMDGWHDEARPFTRISLPGEANLEFIFKIYPGHNGVTVQIAKMRPGDEVTIEGPFGDIGDCGPGVFIAGRAGITSMIALLRKRLQCQGN